MPARIAGALAAAAALALVLATYAPLWRALLVAAVLAAATGGLHGRLAARLRGKRHLAAAIMTCGLVGLVLLPVVVVATVVVRQTIDGVAYLEEVLRQGGWEGVVARLPRGIEQPVRALVTSLGLDLRAQAEQGGAALARVAGDVAGAASRTLFGLTVMLVAYFALLTDGERLIAWGLSSSRVPAQQTRLLLTELRWASRALIRSFALAHGAQAAVAGIGYVIAGVPHALFFAVLTFFAAFVPAVGTFLVAIPLVLVRLFAGALWQAVFLAIWAAVAVGLVDNLLKPWLAREGVRAHGVVVLFALLGGVLAFGWIGVILGPLSVAGLLAMLRLRHRSGVDEAESAARSSDAPADPATELDAVLHGGTAARRPS